MTRRAYLSQRAVGVVIKRCDSAKRIRDLLYRLFRRSSTPATTGARLDPERILTGSNVGDRDGVSLSVSDRGRDELVRGLEFITNEDPVRQEELVVGR